MIDDDEIALATLRLLPPDDVSAARARSLRERCHGELRKRTRRCRRRAEISAAGAVGTGADRRLERDLSDSDAAHRCRVIRLLTRTP